jgi:hypothetical protein
MEPPNEHKKAYVHGAKLLKISILKEKSNEIKIKTELKDNRNNRFYMV